jgi:hypothetical protein
MHPLEKIARLEEVINLLDEINMVYATDQAAVWNTGVEGDPGNRRLDFLIKIATAIGILQNQVEYEKESISDGDEDKNSMQ